jgi:hypothetical protein|tara:strand:+ start:3375 stop:3536 length:162 start_codon:yes stop_codon:yes gene_type:complete
MRADINDIALYSEGVYPIRDLYCMSYEMIYEIKKAMLAKAEALNPKKSNTQTF